MKNPNWTRALLATSLVLAFSALPIMKAQAELVSEEVQEDAITPEGGQKAPAKRIVVREEEDSSLEPEVVVVRKKAPKRQKVIIQQEEEESSDMAISSNNENTNLNSNTTVVQTNSAPRKGIGSSLDEGIDNKITDVRNQFESALLKSLDRIKISVDDGSSAQVQNTTVVQDTVVTTNAAATPAREEDYLSIDRAPRVSEKDGEEVAGTSEVEAEKKSTMGAVRIAPVIGFTSMSGSDGYNVDSRYTAGVDIEVDVESNLTAVLGYSYSQYDVSLANTNPFFNGNYSAYSNNLNKLGYNQNVFSAGLRFYILPRESRFRAFVGAGLGYNKGYLNYKQNNNNNYGPQYNINPDVEDYEVTSFLGILETGAEIQLSKNISVGGLFKYSNVVSSRENRPLYANQFYNGYAATPVEQAGGSIAENNFYSILGTVKFSF